MPETTTPITNTTRYPTFASKTACLTALNEMHDMLSGDAQEQFTEILFRLSNTDTDDWTADSTARHDA